MGRAHALNVTRTVVLLGFLSGSDVMKRAFSWFLGSKSQSGQKVSWGRQFRPSMESLERRLALAGEVYSQMDQGALVIEGTSQSDSVQVSLSLVTGQGDPVGKWRIVVMSRTEGRNGTAFTTFDPSEVKAIIFRGNAGHDHFINYTNLGLLAHGGPGNDIIYGGKDGFAEIYGDGDHDKLIGTQKNNKLDGGPGDDILFGLDGNDILLGGPDRDELNGYEGADVMF